MAPPFQSSSHSRNGAVMGKCATCWTGISSKGTLKISNFMSSRHPSPKGWLVFELPSNNLGKTRGIQVRNLLRMFRSRRTETEWINSRPEEENWEIIPSGILGNSLGTDKFTYHPSTVRAVFRYTQLRIPTPSNVPPLIMAPFEILSNPPDSVDSRIDSEIWRRIPREKPNSHHGESGNEPREANFDEVRNLTVEIACEIRDPSLHLGEFSDIPNLLAATSNDNPLCDIVYMYSLEVRVDHPDLSESELGELILCKVVRHILKVITCDSLGGVPETDERPTPSLRDVVQSFTMPEGPSLSYFERELTEFGFCSYLSKFHVWPCSLKGQLVPCITGDGKMRVVKMAPDISSVLFVHNQNPAKYFYMHSGRGIAINSLCRKSHYGRERDNLRFHRGSWETQSRIRTAVAWIWILFSLGLSVYRSYDQRSEGALEAFVAGVELLSILLIAVFGFAKLYVYDDAVLFRLMTGWRALNSRQSMLRYFCPNLRDIEECEAQMATEVNSRGDELFAPVNSCAYRTRNKTGIIRLEGVKDEYLGRAGYICFGTLIIDYVLKEVVLVRQFETGLGHFEKRAPLTTENVSKFLEEGSEINESAERELITRRCTRYQG